MGMGNLNLILMNCGGKPAFRYKIHDNSQRKLARIIAALVITG